MIEGGQFGSVWQTMGSLLAVLAPLAAVPLTVITFYLRSLREQQVSWQRDWTRRIDAIEVAGRELQRMLEAMQRDYTTKEEWLREHLHARQTLERLGEAVVRMQTAMDSRVVQRESGAHEQGS